MKKLLCLSLLACLLVSPALAATNTVNISWMNPQVDVEGNPLPDGAIASYDVLVGDSQDMVGAEVVENVPPATEPNGDGDYVQTASLPLGNGVWYISVRAIDVIGQVGPLKAPVVHTTLVAPGEVRDLKIVTVSGSVVTVGVNVNVGE